jgi:hypothetical protein
MHVDSLVRPIVVVCAGDPALDMSVSERRAYAESRDPAKIRELPGKSAVRYVIRPLTVSQSTIVDQRVYMHERLLWAFMLACGEIQNADTDGPSAGKRMTPTRTIDMGGHKAFVWDDRELDVIQEAFGRAALYEIGGVIWERTLRGKAAGGSVPYTVPQSLLDELALLALRPAAPPSE